MSIKPSSGYILIEPIEDGETYAGGLVVPEGAKDKPSKGKVIAVPEGECPAKKDDVVVFKRYGGQEFREEGKVLRFIEFKDVMGIYNAS